MNYMNMSTKLKFNYIALNNAPEQSKILFESGIQQIMVVTEILGKVDRQKHKNTVISNHEIEDVRILKQSGVKAQIICRVNPYHQKIFSEIEKIITMGADSIMLPMISSLDYYKEMVDFIDSRVNIIPLIETPYSFFKLDDILKYKKLEQIHFGLNDLSISLGMKNLFEILFSKPFSMTVKEVSKEVDLLGIGGVGTPMEKQIVDPILIFKKMRSLGANSVILSRSFFKNGYNKDIHSKSLLQLEQDVDNFSTYEEESLFNQIKSFSN